MCGIIGYIGSKPVVPVLLEGLRRMEYRGYDSAGVAVVSPEGIALRRSAGKLANLENAIRTQPVDGLYGVGHTRWATHGRPTEENAHPHRDCTGTYRRRSQRHHRELPGAEGRAPGAGARVQDRNGHGDRRAPGRARDAGRRPRKRRAPRAEAHARHVRARARLGGRPGKNRRGSQRPARLSWDWARTNSSSRPTFQPSWRTRATSSFSATKRWRSSRGPACRLPTSPGAPCRRRRSE